MKLNKEHIYYFFYFTLLAINLLIVIAFNPVSNSQKTWFTFGGIFTLINSIVLTLYLTKNKQLFLHAKGFAGFAYNSLLFSMISSMIIFNFSREYFYLDFLILPALGAPFVSLGILSVILSLINHKRKYSFKKEYLFLGLSAIFGAHIFPYFFKFYFPTTANIFSIILMAGIGGVIGGLIGWKLIKTISKKLSKI